jgi:sodium transport system permease protein
MRRAFVVYAKELRDAVRDRRTMLMVVFVSIVTGPLSMLLMAEFVTSLDKKTEARKVRMVGEEFAPPLVNYLKRVDVEIEKAPADYEARVKEGTLDAVIVVRPDFHERFLAGDDNAVELVYDDSRAESQPSISQAERLLRGFNRETGTLRLIARGVSPNLIEAVKVEHVNTATARQKGAFLFFVIPLFAILAPILGALSMAIDATAGERERGSLEPLLTNPVPASQIVVGKWLAAWTAGSLTALLTLASFVFAATMLTGKKLATLLQFGWPEFALFMAFVIPLAAATSSFLMLVATYGRSYREAQTYTSYFVSLISFIPIVALFAGIKDSYWQLTVPVLGQQMVFTRVLRGEAVTLADWATTAGVAMLIALVCVTAISRLMSRERIVFGRA